MLTQTDKDKQELAQIDAAIADAEEKLARKRVGVAALEAFLDQKYARRMVVEARVAREEAPLQKPTGHCVTLTDGQGVAWKV